MRLRLLSAITHSLVVVVQSFLVAVAHFRIHAWPDLPDLLLLRELLDGLALRLTARIVSLERTLVTTRRDVDLALWRHPMV